MVEKYRNYIENISKETGFIGSTLEKVERLIRILQWINSDEKLNKLLALKGGTAINTAVFNFTRLSVDIDLDLTENIGKEEMIEQRKNKKRPAGGMRFPWRRGVDRIWSG